MVERDYCIISAYDYGLPRLWPSGQPDVPVRGGSYFGALRGLAPFRCYLAVGQLHI